MMHNKRICSKDFRFSDDSDILPDDD